jgi:hypothetical protein
MKVKTGRNLERRSNDRVRFVPGDLLRARVLPYQPAAAIA